jgi:hypothetical protein
MFHADGHDASKSVDTFVSERINSVFLSGASLMGKWEFSGFVKNRL